MHAFARVTVCVCVCGGGGGGGGRHKAGEAPLSGEGGGGGHLPKCPPYQYGDATVCIYIYLYSDLQSNITTCHTCESHSHNRPSNKNSSHKIVSDIRKIAHQCYTHCIIIRHEQPCYHTTIAMFAMSYLTVSTSGAIM